MVTATEARKRTTAAATLPGWLVEMIAEAADEGLDWMLILAPDGELQKIEAPLRLNGYRVDYRGEGKLEVSWAG